MAKFSILTVCTGNICRSPLAEQLLAQGVHGHPAVRFSSAGVSALAGQPMTQQAQCVAQNLGISHSGDHIARQLTPAILGEADLILALTREHRAQIVEIVPRAVRRTFTVRELARLLVGVTDAELTEELSLAAPQDTAGNLAAWVEVAACRRGMVERAERPEDEDVIDPYRGNDELYQLSAQQLLPAIAVIARSLNSALAVSVP